MLPKEWSRAAKKCRSCSTARFLHVARGFCKRCYPLVQKLLQAKDWDVNNPRSFAHIVRNVAFWKPDALKKIRTRRIATIQARLEFLKTREEQLNEEIDGLDLENEFNWIAKRCGSVRADLFRNTSTFFDHNFTPEQKRLIFRILNDIQENLRRGRSFSPSLYEEIRAKTGLSQQGV